MEMKTENGVPFLDIFVMRNPNRDHGLQHRVNRKPTNSNLYIHSFSCHSSRIKLRAISSTFLRARTNCDAEFIDQEISLIFDTFLKLYYAENVYFIERSILKLDDVISARKIPHRNLLLSFHLFVMNHQ